MSDFGIPLLIIAMLAILAVDVFSVSYLKTALLDMRMRKPGFFIGSAGICVASIILSLIMAGAFLQSPVKAETTEVPKAGTVQEEVEEETKQNELEEPEEPEAKEPELTQATAVTSTTVTAPTVSANVPAAPAAQATLNTQATVPTFGGATTKTSLIILSKLQTARRMLICQQTVAIFKAT